MGKIARKKRKGGGGGRRRSTKTDLTRPVGSVPTRSESDLRRSTRRRNLTYIGDFYDDLYDEDELEQQLELEQQQQDDDDDDDDDEEDEDAKRKKKKLKLVLKLPHGKKTSRGRVGSASQAVSASSSDYEDDNKPLKKRRINGHDDDVDEVNDVDDLDDEVRSIGFEEDEKKAKQKNVDSSTVPGTPTDSQSGIPLPDSKQLEFILDKLQKKDTYGVYAEPVDPEELPDYHDVIEHPMDFGTIRKKLASRKYTNLEQFENDVVLVCSNAMQYNAPETVYFKQARSIQELATKKFQRLRFDIERAAAELKSEQNIKSNSIVKKPIKKSPFKTIQEPVWSDFSSGAILATVRDICTLSNRAQTGGGERPINVDGYVEGNGNSSLTENKPEKPEEQLSGKTFRSKFVKKTFAVDENRRATYNISNQPVVRDESMTTIFEGEKKQLLSVGLHADHSYARSLARFAATLGPVAWKVASRRIEQALPVGFKFGHGWVGEYEPLPTPVVMLGNLLDKQPATTFRTESIKKSLTGEGLKVGEQEPRPEAVLMADNNGEKHASRFLQMAPSREDNKAAEGLRLGENDSRLNSVRITENNKQKHTGRGLQIDESSKDDRTGQELKARQDELQPGIRTISSAGVKAMQDCEKEGHSVGLGPTSEGNLGLFGVAGTKPIARTVYQRPNQSTTNFMRPESNISNKVELNCSSSSNRNPSDIAFRKQRELNSETSRLLEMVSRNKNLALPVTFKQPETDGVVAGALPNGKAVSSYSNNQVSSLPHNFVSNHQVRPATHFSRGSHEQGLSDPVQMMRMLAEKAQQQQKKSSNLATADTQATPSDLSSRNDSGNAARAWMTLGDAQFKTTHTSGAPKMQLPTASLYNAAREAPQTVPQYRDEASVSGRRLQSEKNKFPPQVFVPQPAHVANERHLQNNRPRVVPQFEMSDLSRLQTHFPWRGLAPHTQLNKKQDPLPPDLNISFQSSGSPARQPSGVMVDSQQPDLALQL